MRISGVGSALPEHRYPQEMLTQALRAYWGSRLEKPEQFERLHAHMRVATRHLAYPMARYLDFHSFGDTNAAWLEAAQQLGERAIDAALDHAGLARRDLNALIVVSVTGVASPSLDARLINRMNLRPDIKRTPIFGVGCVGGALGLSRAADHVLAYPDQTAAVLAVETCSLTLDRNDLSTANLIATGLFGDGAAAVVVSGARAKRADAQDRGPEIMASHSVFYPESEKIMGWDISENGFKIVLSPQLMDLIRANLGRDVDAFLAGRGLSRADIGNWVIHNGGPRVLEAMQEALGLDEGDAALSWSSLNRIGNLSSASVLMVLEDTVKDHRPEPGTLGVLLAMGPGFSSEMILLKW
ncbi:type III polyketide synthase [Methylocystis bryophila]|uniref:Type III polyketide synthase n=1 Tax=Methylocystis bryophila TaxID=655015 RepID=A0A1W6MU41_9HYPH|nr:3-oxoacyl-[acyl-carrier-protein] synthase III C-terminal domain-containing protein [Methylocystis bryophila]ARN81120.1 type III polyketide synthase [Methylocystis bryophila]BDV37048.1 stilbene synthase [Methylocystis bryophila]